MTTTRFSLIRDLGAMVLIALVCPFSVFGGANLGCIGHAEFSGTCAITMIVVSPLILLAGGALAGVLTRGWTGLLFTLVGMVAGMVAILLLSQASGQAVPVDIFSGVVASFFFGFPIVIGYGFARVLAKLMESRTA
jgi:hypothetical protein